MTIEGRFFYYQYWAFCSDKWAYYLPLNLCGTRESWTFLRLIYMAINNQYCPWLVPSASFLLIQSSRHSSPIKLRTRLPVMSCVVMALLLLFCVSILEGLTELFKQVPIWPYNSHLIFIFYFSCRPDSTYITESNPELGHYGLIMDVEIESQGEAYFEII